MHSFFTHLFAALLSWWGVWLIAALDSTIVFFVPLGIDLAVIILVSRSPHMLWVYPLLASLGSVCGAVVTYYMGRGIGEVGLKRLVPEKRLERAQRRLEKKGAIAVAALDLLPPPFPFTAFILAAGAIEINPVRFFVSLGLFRFVRFGGEAALAYFYGRRIIGWFSSDLFEYIAISLFFIAAIGTAIAIVKLVRSTRSRPGSERKPHAA